MRYKPSVIISSSGSRDSRRGRGVCGHFRFDEANTLKSERVRCTVRIDDINFEAGDESRHAGHLFNAGRSMNAGQIHRRRRKCGTTKKNGQTGRRRVRGVRKGTLWDKGDSGVQMRAQL